MRQYTERELDIIIGGIRYQMVCNGNDRRAIQELKEWVESDLDFYVQFGTHLIEAQKRKHSEAHRRANLMLRYSCRRPVQDAPGILPADELEIITAGISFDFRFTEGCTPERVMDWTDKLPVLYSQMEEFIGLSHEIPPEEKPWFQQATLMGQFIIGQPMPQY